MMAIPQMLTVHIPLTVRRRGGRKVVIAPDGTEAPVMTAARIDSTLVKALARAFRWRRMLESGVVTTVGEMAVREKIIKSYVSRVLRLTLLAPEIVEMILDGRQPAEMTLAALMEPFALEWEAQCQFIANRSPPPPSSHRHHGQPAWRRRRSQAR